MNPRIVTVEHESAKAWIAFNEEPGVAYCYGGTRMVAPSSTDTEVSSILTRLMFEESAFKNRLINAVVSNGALAPRTQELPPGFLGSKVGGARCVIKPKDEAAYQTFQNIDDVRAHDRLAALFQVIGEQLNQLGGVVKLTPDFGRFAGLADILARFTPHVLGIACDQGGCGGKSSYSATGIIAALEALHIDAYRGGAFTLIGANGALGVDVLRYLCARDFPDLAVCDLSYSDGSAVPPEGLTLLPSEPNRFTNQCLRRGGVIIATTFGGELEKSDLEALPSDTLLVLAHNLSLPNSQAGIDLVQSLRKKNITVIPGQLLTFGGALTSRLEWFWRSSRVGIPFPKELAHTIVSDSARHFQAKVAQIRERSNSTHYEAMLAFANATGV